MKDNLVGKTVYWGGGYYKVAYVMDNGNDEVVIEFPKGWTVCEKNNKKFYGNMLSVGKKYWIISNYIVVINKTINNE